MKALQTNIEPVTTLINQYLLDCIDSSGYSLNIETDTEKLQFVRDCFEGEYNFLNNKKRYPNTQKRLSEWFMGLPSCIGIDFENYKILEIAVKWGTLLPNATEKKQDIVLNNWFNLMAMRLMQLSKKHGIIYE